MPRITFIEFNGTAHTVQASSGQSLMQAAIDHGVPGIDADCGGGCACGTCHVFVEAPWQPATGQADKQELGMLGMRPDQAENSRLSCQIQLDDSLDGLTVRLPEYQM